MGLADLGSGVTEQLLALDKDEQKQAQELFALYSAREKIRYDRYSTQRDYDKDRNKLDYLIVLKIIMQTLVDILM